MPRYMIIFCVVVLMLAVAALFWGLEYFLNPDHEAYVWDQYEDKIERSEDSVEYGRGGGFRNHLRNILH